MAEKWIESGEKCPNCGAENLNLLVTVVEDGEEQELIEAEKCPQGCFYYEFK